VYIKTEISLLKTVFKNRVNKITFSWFEEGIREMKGNSRLRDLFFWSALLILVVTVYLIPAAYYRWLNFRFVIGPEPFHHWLS